MINPHLLLELGRERHRDLLNEAEQRRSRRVLTEPAPARSDDVIIPGRARSLTRRRLPDASRRAAS